MKISYSTDFTNQQTKPDLGTINDPISLQKLHIFFLPHEEKIKIKYTTKQNSYQYHLQW